MNVSNSYAKLHLNYIQTKSFVLKVVIRGGVILQILTEEG